MKVQSRESFCIECVAGLNTKKKEFLHKSVAELVDHTKLEQRNIPFCSHVQSQLFEKVFQILIYSQECLRVLPLHFFEFMPTKL